MGWRLALRHPERIAAIITQNGNAYVEGFVGDAMEPLFAYGRERSEANAAALRETHQHGRVEMAIHPWCFGPVGGRPRHLDQRTLSGREQPGDGSPRSWSCSPTTATNVDAVPTRARILPHVAGAAAGGVGPQRPDLRAGRRVGVRARSPRAEINLLDGGHFLLESRLTEVVALIRPFLDEHLAQVADTALASLG